MEQADRRDQFIKNNFYKVFKNMVLTESLLKQIYSDENNPCKHLTNTIKQLEDQKEAQKTFIILEFTKERNSVKYLAKLLRNQKNDQAIIADYLEEYNQTEPFMDYVDNEYIRVRTANHLRSGTSMCFEMETSPRGLCLIFLNEMLLLKQAKQLSSVFTQLFFTVKIKQMKTTEQINKILETIATDEKYSDQKALVTIAIGHGFNHENGPVFVTHHENKLSFIHIAHMIDIFAEDKSTNFKTKPKINIFDCCRSPLLVADEIDSRYVYNDKLLDKIKVLNRDHVNNFTNTTVIYSCSKGQKGFANQGFTRFGRAPSHTIAQFACEKNLDDLLKILNKRLDADQEKRAEKQLPEIIQFNTKFNLYFNPGLVRSDSEYIL